jgi:hypothetical protein
METTFLRTEAANERWIVILGCPCPEKHVIKDPEGNLSGPSFAVCSSCEHQEGTNFHVMGKDGEFNGADIFPERLVCGFNG